MEGPGLRVIVRSSIGNLLTGALGGTMNADLELERIDDRTEQLTRRIDELARELDALKSELQRGALSSDVQRPAVGGTANDSAKVAEAGSGAANGAEHAAMSRRHALRAAGVLAAGAVAGGAGIIATATPAAAAQGNFNGGSPAVIANGGAGASSIGVDAQVQGTNGRAVQGTSTGNDGVGVYGEGPFAGIHGTSINGLGVYAESAATHAVFADMGAPYPDGIALAGVYGRGTNGIGVSGVGRIGMRAAGDVAGVQATASEDGYPAIEARGDVGVSIGTTGTAFRFDNTATSPLTSGGTYETRDIVVDSAGVIWFCVAGGTPGTWRMLSGPSTAGAFTPLTPARVYDSRLGTYAQNGVLGGGQNRTISVANSYNVNGVQVTANFVPVGATAVFANVTVVDTVGAGYLAVNPGGTTVVSASTINWSASGQVLANGVVLTLNGSRQLSVINGSGGSTQFIIDVLGYYR